MIDFETAFEGIVLAWTENDKEMVKWFNEQKTTEDIEDVLMRLSEQELVSLYRRTHLYSNG